MAIGNATGQIRILVVDDSAFMRKALTMMLEADPMIKVIGTARDGEEGVEKVRRLKPDLVTMDIEMPRMDGLAALRQIMLNQPGPGDDDFIADHRRCAGDPRRARNGAVDFIPKAAFVCESRYRQNQRRTARKDQGHRAPESDPDVPFAYSATRSRTAADVDSGSAGRQPTAAPNRLGPSASANATITSDIVVIGSSTGGPPALQEIDPATSAQFAGGILIAQHMPPTFYGVAGRTADGCRR